MEPANPRILTINGGSSSIKFALFEVGTPLQRILSGGIERIGTLEATSQRRFAAFSELAKRTEPRRQTTHSKNERAALLGKAKTFKGYTGELK